MKYIYSFIISLLLVSTNICLLAQSKVAPPTTNGLPGDGISPPSGSPGSRCGTGTVVISASAGTGGNMVRWYANQNGGSPLETNYTLVTPYLYSTTTFYMTTYNTSTGGESAPRTAINAYIYNDPANPSVANVTRCGSGIVTFSGSAGSGGNTIEWRDAPTGGTLLYMDTFFSTPSLSSNTTYYINSYNTATGCRSARIAVTAVINIIPGAPVINTPPTICGSGSVTLSASPGSNGNAIYWTDLSGNVLTNGVTPVISTNTFFKAYTYNTAIGLSCKSTNTSVEVIVNPLPGAPSITPAYHCGPGMVNLSASGGANESVRWYASLSGGSQITPSGSTYAPNISATTTYYVSLYNNVTGCESGNRTPITATIRNTPPPPDFLGQGTTGCGSGVVRLNAFDDVNGTIKWYTSITDTNASGTGNTFDTPYLNTTTTYYLSTTNSWGCESSRIMVTAVVTSVPPTPVFDVVAICKGTNVLLAPQSLQQGSTINWYTSTGTFITQSASLPTPVLSESVSYVAEAVSSSINTCKSIQVAVPVTVNPIPNRPVTATDNWANGSGTVTLKAAVPSGQQVNWYSDEQAVNYLNTGTEFTTPLLTTSTMYYAQTQDMTTSCKSPITYYYATVLPLISPALIQQDIIRISGIKEESSLASVSDADRIMQFNYVDGLSRVHQQVIKSASPLGKDIVQPVEYDVQGRTSKSYLPYVSTTADGSFQSAYESGQASFYTASNDKIINDANPYALTTYESSPLGRVNEQGNTGASWQPGTAHTLRTAYSFNTGATTGVVEEVREFKTDGSSTAFYAANLLHRIKSTDPDGKIQVIFQDARGNTLAKKQQLDQSINGAMVNWLETYYIYDDMERIKYILSPKGVVALKANAWTLSAGILDSYAQQFVYDYRGRLVEKKTPGQAWNYVVYDKLNRVVLTQDGLLRADNKWSFIKYDQKGRAVMQGIYVNGQTTRSALQLVADDLYSSSNTSFPGNAWYENRGTVLHGYSNITFPQTNADSSPLEVWNVNYYDTYDFDYNGTADYSYSVQSLPNENTPVLFTTGIATGSKRLVLGTSDWLYNYIFYDDQYRVIQVRSNNQLNPYLDDLTTTVYDFEGKVLSTKVQKSDAQCLQKDIVQRFSYDMGGRIKNIYAPVVDAENMSWSTVTEVSVNGNSAIKSATTNTWEDGDLVSSNYLAANQNGWVEFKTGEYTNYKLLGLSDQEADANFTTIDYAIYLTDGQVAIIENGVHVTTIGTFTSSDVFSVERKAGAIYYKKNNTIFYSSLNPNTGILYVQGAIYSSQGTFNSIQLYKETEKIVAQYEYNELGQVVDKKLHNTTGSEFLQSVDYRYTLHGELASINNSQLTSDSGTTNDETNDFFGIEYLYSGVVSGLGNTALYNGNISAVKWKGAGAASGAMDQKSYKYTYDKSNKLLTATSQVYGTAWNKEAGALSESMTYDHNGNISGLQRNQRKHQLTGLISSYTFETIDNLTYTYNGTTGDQLEKVTDAATPLIAGGFSDGSSGTNTDYTYDGSGNVLSDLNKGISNISYNLLGKPVLINFSDGKKIDYVYDAAGSKLTMQTWQDNTLLTRTDYVNGYQYENGLLKTYAAPEGRVVMKGTNPEYQYAIADQQGNTRVVFSSAPVKVESNNTGMEETDNASFQNYPTGGSRSQLSIYNHTTGGTYSQLLNGGNNSQVGVAKSYKVYPGDKVKIEAYAKYANPTSNSSNVTAFASALLNAFMMPAPVAGELGTASSALNSWGSVVAVGGDGQSNSAPHVSVNILVFDKNYNFLDAAYDQIAASAQQVGVTPVKAHDYMTKEYTVKEEGYVFMYIANENATQVDAYFDDVVTTYTPTSVVQYNEYYPFGLQAATSWTRESNSNNYLYNAGNELNATTGWYDLAYRNYDPSIGRFMQVDPLAHLDHSITSFAYAGNNPILFNDPNGDKVNYENGQMVGSQEWANAQYAEAAAYGYAMAMSWAQDGGGGGYFDGAGASMSWSTSDPMQIAAILNANKNGMLDISSDSFSYLYLDIGAGVEVDTNGNPIPGTEAGANIFYYNKVDLKISRDLIYGNGQDNGNGSNGNFWETADNIGDGISALVSPWSLAGGISRWHMAEGKSLSQLKRVISSDKFIALKQYNKVLGAAGKILGYAGVVTSFGELVTEDFSWTNVGKFAINVGSLALKANPIGLTVSLGIGLLDYSGYLDIGLNKLFNENTER